MDETIDTKLKTDILNTLENYAVRGDTRNKFK